MRSKMPAAMAAVALLNTPLFGQAPDNQRGSNQKQPEEVVRIGVTLVQVDAVATDRKGRYVTDLKPEDFLVQVDGHPQKITNFSYISAEAHSAPAAPGPVARGAGRPGTIDSAPVPIRSAALPRDQVGRTFALVVDDLTMSFESICYVREALKNFVDQQMAPGDLAAIVKTSGGIGLLQQFTANKEQLYAAIDKVQWSSAGMGRTNSVDLFSPDIVTILQQTAQAQAAASPFPGAGAKAGADANPVDPGIGGAGDSVTDLAQHSGSASPREFDQFREEMYSVGTLGTLDYVIHGLKPLPGRKSLLLFSDGFRMFYDTDHDDSSYVVDPLRNLVDLANRSSVVIYTIDSRGLQTLGISAADNVTDRRSFSDPNDPASPPFIIRDVGRDRTQREKQFFDSQQGLGYLASGTGGLALSDTNDLSGAIAKVARDQSGYYLIGFVPDDSMFKTIKGHLAFHNVSVKVTKPGLRVRSRQGFIGATDEAMARSSQTPIAKLAIALSSPFAADDINLKLTALFWHLGKEGSFIYSLLHIDPQHLTFTDLPGDRHQASFRLLELTFGDNGRLSGRSVRTETVNVSDAAYRYILDNGLVFANTTAVKGSGALQYRVAVQDESSGKMGTASSFVTIPDLGKHRLALSGIFLRPASSAAAESLEASAAASEVPGLRDSAPALRTFTPGTNLDVSFVAYNARRDKSGHADLDLVVRLVKDGKVTFTGPVVPFHPEAPAGSKGKKAGDPGLGAEARFRLGDHLEPGAYAFQVICRDELAKPKQSLASQWIDFDVTR